MCSILVCNTLNVVTASEDHTRLAHSSFPDFWVYFTLFAHALAAELAVSGAWRLFAGGADLGHALLMDSDRSLESSAGIRAPGWE